MPTPHLEAAADDYAETVLLPGDPLRAKWIAETFFESPRQVNGVRNCLGFTGTWKGQPVSVQASGMGQPSLGIYVHELLESYNVQNLIRVGTCGAISPRLALNDVVIASTASTDGAMNRDVFQPFSFAPTADYRLMSRAAGLAEERGFSWRVGGIVSTDVFYHPRGKDVYAPLAEHGVLAVEMEAAALYTLAARFDAAALAICSVSDSLVTGEAMPAADRQSSLIDMVTLALDTAVTG